MLEVVKVLGGIGWVVGLVLLFLAPGIGLFFIIIALVATIWVRSKDRELKHAELVQASRGRAVSTSPAVSGQPSTSERLAQLDKLRESGAVSDEEYDAKRKDILDSL